MSQIEAEYKQVQADLKKVGDDLKAYAEQAQADIKRHQSMSEETKAKVDELLVKQGELQANLQAVEQVIARLESGGGHSARPKTMGQIVTESDEFQARAATLARSKGSFTVPVQAALTSDAASAGDLIEPTRVPGVVATPERRLFIRDLLNWGRTGSNAVEYVKETGFTNGADVVSENPSDGKPESSLVFDLASAHVATIAHWLQASKQVLSDAAMLQSYIDGRLRYGLKLKEEAQLLKGSGVGLNINGIYTQASSYVNPGVSVDQDTIIDRLRLAMLQVQLAEYTADGIVLSPIDWAAIELTKDTQGRYIFANPVQLAGPVLWGLPVVATQSMDAGDFLTGAFRMGAQGWDREDATVTVSTEDRDNFIKNMVTILCEERVGLTVYRPEAFVKGDFTITSSGA
jgi:HK97 family phage major capsid protein